MNRLQSNLTVTLLTLKSFANFFALFFSSFYRLTFVLKIMTFLMLYMLLEGWHFYSPRVPPPPPIMIRFFLIIFPTCLSFHVPRYFFAPLVPLEQFYFDTKKGTSKLYPPLMKCPFFREKKISLEQFLFDTKVGLKSTLL